MEYVDIPDNLMPDKLGPYELDPLCPAFVPFGLFAHFVLCLHAPAPGSTDI